MELFADQARIGKNPSQPLADRMRPATIDEFVGQDHLLGSGKLLRGMIAAGKLQSLILWGPPGSGKTTLAQILARAAGAACVHFSAVTSGVKDLKKIIQEAEQLRRSGKPTVLFVDEIHHFNKAQQDNFLPHVERGTLTLIGATTENPSFEIISPLIRAAACCCSNRSCPVKSAPLSIARSRIASGVWEICSLRSPRPPEPSSSSSRKEIVVWL